MGRGAVPELRCTGVLQADVITGRHGTGEVQRVLTEGELEHACCAQPGLRWVSVRFSFLGRWFYIFGFAQLRVR